MPDDLSRVPTDTERAIWEATLEIEIAVTTALTKLRERTGLLATVGIVMLTVDDGDRLDPVYTARLRCIPVDPPAAIAKVEGR